MINKLLVFKDENYNIKRNISLLVLITLFSAIFGFIYEEIFYKIDLGYYIKRGSTYGPWIPIYAVGGLLIIMLTYRYKDKPLLVFILNTLITGVLEYASGFILDKIFDLRLWDYNKEIWNFGNIDGYICLRSVLFFGISSLFLFYLVIPIIKKITKRLSDKILFIISLSIGIIFIFDIIIYMILNYF